MLRIEPSSCSKRHPEFSVYCSPAFFHTVAAYACTVNSVWWWAARFEVYIDGALLCIFHELLFHFDA